MRSDRARAQKALALLAGALVGGLATIGAVRLGSAALGMGPPAPPEGPPRMVDESVESGIGHVYDGGFPYFVGGGVAVFDCSGDLRPDLYLAGGSNPAGLYRNQSRPGAGLDFTRVEGGPAEVTGVLGAYPLDVDSDGMTDLALLRFGENLLLRGLGDCRFEAANERWGVEGGEELTVAFSATWEAGRRLPTLAFGNYVTLGPNGERGECADHRLLRPRGEAYGPGESLSPGRCTLSMLFSDWSRTGRRDLRTTNDRHYYREGEEQLWRFVEGEPPRPYTAAEGWRTMQIWGMGIASHDLTGDGRPEVFLTSQGDNKLQSLATDTGAPTYEDIAFERGATAHRPYAGDVHLPSTAWHPEFADVNNDGYIDLFVSKGNVDAMTDYASRDPSNLLLGQEDGTFTEAGSEAGIVHFGRSRGAAVVDLDLDGMLDLVEMVRSEPVRLWRNAGAGTPEAPVGMGDWVALHLEQPPPNRDAVGAWVEVRSGGKVRTQEVVVGGGHAGGEEGWIHFGLGDAKRVEIRVRWPDGERSPWMATDTNRFLLVARGAETVEVWNPEEGQE